MKKLIALLLCLAMLLSAFSTFALAEAIDETVLLNYHVEMDALPEGYTMETVETEGGIYLLVASEFDEDCMYFISVAPSEEFADYTLKSDELTDEQLADMMDVLTEEYAEPTLELQETDYGTTVIVINENDGESDYADLVTIWHGYFVGVTLLKQDELTDEDIATGMKLLSDLWVVDNAPAAAPTMAGGWAIPADPNLTNEQLDIFYKAAGDETELQPMALLGTQLVAGTNYAVLCQDVEGWKIAYIYAALDGTAELVRTQLLFAVNDELPGGWVRVTGESLTVEDEAKIASAFEGMLGANYELDLVLAQQLVAGTNYAVLTRKTLVTAEPVTNWAVVTVYVDLQGNASITDVQDVNLSLYE